MKKLIIGGLLAVFLVSGSNVSAGWSVPRTLEYQGVILDSSSNPVTDTLTFRFSLWSDGDYISSDMTADGEINALSLGFSGYQEVQNITPDKNGNFYANIGEIVPVPRLRMGVHDFLQVEVKILDESSTKYKILDVDDDIDNSIDRKRITSSPYAISAETVGNKNVGFEAGEIPTLDENGKLPEKVIPWRKKNISDGIFVIEGDSVTDVKLQFGSAVAKVIKWAKSKARFEIGDSIFVWGDVENSGNVKIAGDVTVDGKINGVDVGETQSGVNAVKSDLDLAKSEIENVKSDAEITKNEIEMVKSRLDAVESGSVAQNTINVLESDLVLVQSKLSNAEIGINTVQTGFDVIQGEVDVLKSDFDKINTEIAVIKSNQTGFDVLSTDLDDVNTEIVTLKAEKSASETGTVANIFILNADGGEGDVKLQFGSVLAKVLKWAAESARFEIGDSVFVWGDVENSGNVNGRDMKNDGEKLDGVETGATADQNAADVPINVGELNAENVRDAIVEVKKMVIDRAVFDWDYLPGTEDEMKNDENGEKNKGFVMMRAGVVSAVAVSANPTDDDADGEFVITKNDGGSFTNEREMTRIEQEKEGKGDENNSVFDDNPTAGATGLSFEAGDVIRAYHVGKRDKTSRVILEVVFN